MMDIRSWINIPRRQKTGSESTPVPGVLNDTMVSMPPKRRVALGRHLAFAISDRSIQMAAADHFGSRMVLHQVTKTYLPRISEESRDHKMHTLAAIREFVGEYGGRRRSISLTLGGPKTALRTITLPKLRSSELSKAVRYEAKHQIPFPMDECVADYRIYQKTAGTSNQRYKIALLAATSQLVESRLAIFSELGLEVDHVYHSEDVIGQLLKHLPDFDMAANHALINIDQEQSEISYYLGGNLEFFHVSSLGSGFLANRSDPTVYEYFAESLATEIQNSLDFYTGQHAARFSNRIYVHGDLAYTDELIDLLSDRFGFEFLRFPAEQLDFVRDKNLEFEYSLPVCLPVLAAVTNQHRLANLLPPARKRKLAERVIDRLSVAALVLILAACLTHWQVMRSASGDAQKSLNILNHQIAEFQATDMYATYSQIKRRMTLSQNYIDKTKESPSYLGLNLKELSQLTPESIGLYFLDYRADKSPVNYQLAGLVKTKSTPPELALAEFVENLSASPFFEDVAIARHVKKRVNGGFELDFQLSLRGII